MRVLVTGAAGFVGRALVQALLPNHDVTATDWQETPGFPGEARYFKGDLRDPGLREVIFARSFEAVIHLATVPGGAAEGDPDMAWSVNVEATRALVEASTKSGEAPLFLFASSIAVFGAPLPSQVDDATPVSPQMLYGGHKAMMEEWIAMQSRRGVINGLSLRLPGIVARPGGPSGMKSAYLSDLFHRMRAHKPMVLPVSAQATSWLLSAEAAAAAFVQGISVAAVSESRRLTLPALLVSMHDLVAEIARQTGADSGLVSFTPDPAIEALFGSQPPLSTLAADTLGFRHDGTVSKLVSRALASLDSDKDSGS